MSPASLLSPVEREEVGVDEGVQPPEVPPAQRAEGVGAVEPFFRAAFSGGDVEVEAGEVGGGGGRTRRSRAKTGKEKAGHGERRVSVGKVR